MDKATLARIANALEQESANLQNFEDSIVGYDSEGYDSEGYDTDDDMYGLAYTGKGRVKPKGQTTYDLEFLYTPVAMAPLPVTITLFQDNFNTNGVFQTNGNLRFTNAGGDYVDVIGLTKPYKAIHNRSTNAPFRINFMRITPKTSQQLGNNVTFNINSVFGSTKTNNISPKTFIDPNQYQLLNVDVPTNFIVDGQRGFTWNINPTEDVFTTLFIDLVLDPTKGLKDGSSNKAIRNLNGRGLLNAHPAISGTSPIRRLNGR